MPTLKTEKQIPSWIRIVREPRSYYRQISKQIKLHSSEAIYEFLSAGITTEEVEVMIVLVFNNAMRLLGAHEVARGASDRLFLGAREAFRAAILLGGSAVVLAHNHTSGNPKASEADIRVTERMILAGCLIGIPVLDHVIIGSPLNRPRFTSMREKRLASFDKTANVPNKK